MLGPLWLLFAFIYLLYKRKDNEKSNDKINWARGRDVVVCPLLKALA